MKKRKAGRIFSRSKGAREGLMLSLVRALALKERIETTEAKAKETSPLFERLVTKSKRDTLATRRELLRYFGPRLTKKMVEEIGPRYKDRPGGYTRITKTMFRKSDGAKMAIIELIK
ncbi:MAG TPA: 50S ribosomal protein L17 [Candidatus Paceibacterota bacterium]|nr:50S ribosomal protein L17 [Candidatus Paceibacterota bacterium]